MNWSELNQEPVWENNQVPAGPGVERNPLGNNTVIVNYRGGLLCAAKDCVIAQTEKINTFSAAEPFREFVWLAEELGTFCFSVDFAPLRNVQW